LKKKIELNLSSDNEFAFLEDDEIYRINLHTSDEFSKKYLTSKYKNAYLFTKHQNPDIYHRTDHLRDVRIKPVQGMRRGIHDSTLEQAYLNSGVLPTLLIPVVLEKLRLIPHILTCEDKKERDEIIGFFESIEKRFEAVVNEYLKDEDIESTYDQILRASGDTIDQIEGLNNNYNNVLKGKDIIILIEETQAAITKINELLSIEIQYEEEHSKYHLNEFNLSELNDSLAKLVEFYKRDKTLIDEYIAYMKVAENILKDDVIPILDRLKF
jgi:hypothetical protein